MTERELMSTGTDNRYEGSISFKAWEWFSLSQ
jgi:hypothetical protein